MKSIWLIIEIEKILDNEVYQQYLTQVSTIVNSYGGRYITINQGIKSLEEKPPMRFIIIEFNTEQTAINLFNSKEYLAIKPLRDKSVRGRAFFV